jgi:hypothetical protein
MMAVLTTQLASLLCCMSNSDSFCTCVLQLSFIHSSSFLLVAGGRSVVAPVACCLWLLAAHQAIVAGATWVV